MKLLTLFSLLATALAGVTNCGGLFQVTELSQSPDTYVKAGDNVTLTLKYNVPSEVKGGTVTTSMSINSIPFSPSTDDLCSKVKCPLTSGSHDGSTWTTFPSGVSGKIVSKVVWKDSSNTQLLCLESTYKTTAVSKALGQFLRSYPPTSGGSSSSSYSSATSSSNSTETGTDNKPSFVFKGITLTTIPPPKQYLRRGKKN